MNTAPNDDFLRAYKIIDTTEKSVFLTGKAGTGKSTFLRYLRENCTKKMVVLAPTGIAALHVKGETIHSFFGFRPNVVVENIRPQKNRLDEFKNLEMLVIDEISMVRADLLDCIDRSLRLHRPHLAGFPFGGVQMVFIGDLFQLPPVLSNTEKEYFQSHYPSEHFFDSNVFRDGVFTYKFIEFDQVYRQKDQQFLSVLNRVRINEASDDDLNYLNSRYDPHFASNESAYQIHLTTTNKLADNRNMRELQKLSSKHFVFEGRVRGDCEKLQMPTQKDLELRIGAQVMFLNNDSAGRWANGTIGRIEDIGPSPTSYHPKVLQVRLANGEVVEVEPHTWEMYHFGFDDIAGKFSASIAGSFTQFPVKLAWAVTIHKSQGQTFDEMVLDLGYGTFSHGQLYVALSRCTTLKGITLKQPLLQKHIIVDDRVKEFLWSCKNSER